MHEVGLAEELIAACIARAAGADVQRIAVRHASTVSEDALRQAFAMLSVGGPLDGASLDTEPLPIELKCGCGFAGILGPEHELGGPAVVCPACGAVQPAPRTPELELLEVQTVWTAR